MVIFGKKVMVKITRSLTLVSFERVCGTSESKCHIGITLSVNWSRFDFTGDTCIKWNTGSFKLYNYKLFPLTVIKVSQ